MVPDVERRARRLLRAVDIFRFCQYLSLAVGVACARLIGRGAGTLVLFGQVIAAIVFGWVYSHQLVKLISTRYPDLNPFQSQWGRRRDAYTPLVRAAAMGQGDRLTVQLLDRSFPLMIRAFALVLIMALLEPILST